MVAKHILVIDDEADIRTIADIGLTINSDWQVTSVGSGQEGITVAASSDPDAILLDVMMPDMDGLATLEQLRSDNLTKHIPVIMMTAKAQAADRRQFYAAGANGVITKPFDPTTLVSQIAGFLEWQL